MATSIRQRSWTCGSQAAFPITVSPGVSAAAMRAFSVAMTDGSSMKTRAALSPEGASITMSRSCLTVAPRAVKASRWGSRRRRPMTSPPGSGITARPNRARRGPARRKEARMRDAWARSSTASGDAPAAHSASSLAPRHSTSTPRPARSSTSDSTSLIRGTLAMSTSSLVRRAAAIIGRAPFLLPAGTTVPLSGTPPSITNFSMVICACGGSS